MKVESIAADNEVFGCVLGVLIAGTGAGAEDGDEGDGDGDDEKLEVPFCGVWRFDPVSGRAVEHWENAADPGRVVGWIRNNARMREKGRERDTRGEKSVSGGGLADKLPN